MFDRIAGTVGWLVRPWTQPRTVYVTREVSVTEPNTALADYVQSTAWYRRYAKSIAAFVAGLANLAWLLTVLPASLVPTNVAVGVALAVQFVVGVIGVVAVPNSPTTKQLEQVQEYVGRHRKPE